jgi:hypothetical protein
MQYYDTNNTGLINFVDFRKVMQNLKLGLSEKYTELLIYIMKTNDNMGLEELAYGNLIKLLNYDDSGSDSDKSKKSKKSKKCTLIYNLAKKKSKDKLLDNNNNEQEDEEEVVITIEQFNEKVDKILSSFAEHLLSSKSKVKDVFRDVINNQLTEDPIEAILLKDFINILQKAGINLDTIDIYCIFTKLKFSDDFEAIDLNKLIEEMCNYGIFDETLSKEASKSKAKEDLYSKLRKHLTEKATTFDNFLFNIVGKISMKTIQGKLVRVIRIDDFETYLQNSGVIGNDEHITDEERTNILAVNSEELVDLQKVKEIVENLEVEASNISRQKKESVNDSLDLGKFDDSEIEGI